MSSLSYEAKFLLSLTYEMEKIIFDFVEDNKGDYENVSVFIRSAIKEKLRKEGVIIK